MNNNENLIMVSEDDKATLRVYIDDDAGDPREWTETISNILIKHPNYTLGDDINIDTTPYRSWDELYEKITSRDDVIEATPIYLYEHGGLTISTSPYNCIWDSGQAGIVWITTDDVKRYYGEVTEETIQQAIEEMEREIELYDCYIRGDVYRYTLTDSQGEYIEGTGSIYGYTTLIEELREYIQEPHTHLIDELQPLYT